MSRKKHRDAKKKNRIKSAKARQGDMDYVKSVVREQLATIGDGSTWNMTIRDLILAYGQWCDNAPNAKERKVRRVEFVELYNVLLDAVIDRIGEDEWWRITEAECRRSGVPAMQPPNFATRLTVFMACFGDFELMSEDEVVASLAEDSVHKVARRKVAELAQCN